MNQKKNTSSSLLAPVSPLKYDWPLYLLSLFLAVGIGISGYLTWHHENELYGDSSVSLSNCPENATINCEVVNTSQYSEMFGVPIAAFAIPTYLLLLFLIFFRRKNFPAIQSVFVIGILTTLYSGFLYYVSTVKVGFLCLWCFRLYLINLSIPLLSALAIGKKPGALFQDLKSVFDFKLENQKAATVVFLGLFVLTLGGQRVYRSTLVKTGQSSSKAFADTPSVVNWNPRSFVIPTKLKIVKKNGNDLDTVEFDAGNIIGKGKPLAFFFHSPSYAPSDSALVETVRFLKENAPKIDLYVVVGKTPEYRVEAAWESLKSLPLPPDLKVIIDEGHVVHKQLEIHEAPTLTLVSGDGTLLALRIRSLGATLNPGNISVTDILKDVSNGTLNAQYKSTPQYFPSSEMMGQCAPAFTLNDINSGKPYTFTGKSPNGKPTLLVFWSSTCKHCQREIPELVRHSKANPGKYNIVSVSHIKLDKTDGTSHRKITQAYMKSQDIKFPVLVDSGKVSSLYGVSSTPTSFVIAPNGEISEGWYFVHPKLDNPMKNALAKASAIKGACQSKSLPNYSKMEFNVMTPDNRSVSLSQLIDRPTVLHFWATWCGPCQEELPGLLAFADKLEKNKGKLQMVSVEDETSGGKIASFLSSYSKQAKSFRNPHGGLASELNLGYQVPRTYILGTKGEILTYFSGAQKWEDPAFQERVLGWIQNTTPERSLSSVKK